jgi:hypothetical protein
VKFDHHAAAAGGRPAQGVAVPAIRGWHRRRIVGIAYMKQGRNDLAVRCCGDLPRQETRPKPQALRTRQLAVCSASIALDDVAKAAAGEELRRNNRHNEQRLPEDA